MVDMDRFSFKEYNFAVSRAYRTLEQQYDEDLKAFTFSAPDGAGAAIESYISTALTHQFRDIPGEVTNLHNEHQFFGSKELKMDSWRVAVADRAKMLNAEENGKVDKTQAVFVSLKRMKVMQPSKAGTTPIYCLEFMLAEDSSYGSLASWQDSDPDVWIKDATKVLTEAFTKK